MDTRPIQSRVRAAAPALVAAALLACGSPALAERTLGVYFDAAGTQCNGTILPGTPGTVYIFAKLESWDPGIHGAEFRFSGLPSTWDAYAEANPEMLAIGDPFANGVTAALGSCAQFAAGVVTLYTVLVLASAPESDVWFTIESRYPPSNPGFRCPLVVNCDAPVYSTTCVEGRYCTVNAARPERCPGTTAIERSSWSAVKAFYRD
jgi:hypothetical protein